MGVISRQPNGLFCRISDVVDAPTFWNASKSELESYLNETHQLETMCVDTWIEKYTIPFEIAKKYVTTFNMTSEEKKEWIKQVSTKKEKL